MYLDPLCNKRLVGLILKDHLKHLGKADFPLRHLVIIDSDDADETIPVVGSLALREPIVPHNASKVLSLSTAPSTPPASGRPDTPDGIQSRRPFP